MQKKLDTKTVPFRGGCNTYLEPALLDIGKYSMVQNFRQMHPGLKKRPGQIRLHTTEDGTNRAMSLYQFSKGKITERHFYAQMSDGDVLESTVAPPTPGTTVETLTLDVSPGTDWAAGNIITGQTSGKTCEVVSKTSRYVYQVQNRNGPFTLNEVIGVTGTAAKLADQGAANPVFTGAEFGTQVHDGTASGMIPASWSNFNDTLLYSNGSDQHQINYGSNGRINKFIVYVSAGTIPDFPVLGSDYTDEVTDGQASTFAILDSLGTIAAYDCVFICVPIPINKLTWTVSFPNVTGSVSAMNYRKNDNSWYPCASFADNTIVDSKTLGKSGTMTWTKPTDSIPTYMFGTYGYWYQWGLASGALNAQVEVSGVTFESSWTALSNLWDGILVDGIEAQFFDTSASNYFTYGTTSITLDAMQTGDYLYIAFADPQEALYIEADVPSTSTGVTIDEITYWNGTSFETSVGTITDNSAGCTMSGYIVLPKRAAGLEQRHCFNETQYYAYWYRLSVSGALSATVNIGILGIPTYDITDYGPVGVCNAPWKNRMVYTFSQYPNYIYITAEGNPQGLNGENTDIKMAGDGRANKVVCMKPFYNELMVFQEEKGVEGGTITLFDGYDPSTFGRVVLSAKYGTMNSQSVEIVEGFDFGGTKDAGLVAFILSRAGILYTEGKTVSHVPNFDEIRNYFDPTNANCIRAGYESHMWLKYDSAFNILRIGLVTASDTYCKTFLTYDLTDLSWGIDSYAQEISAFTECEAASGTAPVVQVGGGVDDGQVYLLNSGLNDVSTAIDAYVTPEYDMGGDIIHIDDLMLRMKVQSAGLITITPYLNSIAQTAFTFAQTYEMADQTIRRHKRSIDLTGQHISLKIQHNTAGESCYLEDMRPKIRELTER